MGAATPSRIGKLFYPTEYAGRSTAVGLANVPHLRQEAGGAMMIECVIRKGAKVQLRFPNAT